MKKKYKTYYEWKINYHDQDGDIVDFSSLEAGVSVDEINETLCDDDPISVELVKRKYELLNEGTEHEWENLEFEWNFYLNWETMSLKNADDGSSPPSKFQKDVKKIKKPTYTFGNCS